MGIHDEGGTSDALTPESAIPVLVGLLSEDGDTADERETPPAQAKAQPDPEPEGTESPEEGEEPDDEEEAEPAPNAPKTRRIKVDGEEVEVTEEELEKGYSRTADYTRKTQKLSDERKTFEAEQLETRGQRQQYAQRLQQVDQALTDLTPAEPDWDQVRQDRPDEFATEYAMWDQHKKRLQAVRDERGRADQAVMKDMVQQHQSLLDVERGKLIEAIPEWKDTAKAKAEIAELHAFGESVGFQKAELDQLIDHRAVLILRLAMQQANAQKARPKVREQLEAVTVVKPGTSTTQKQPVSALTRAKQRLAKTGRVEDATPIMESFLLD
jgi:hypothetical protein